VIALTKKKTTDLSIGEISKLSGFSASALRYYETERLLPKSVRQGGKRRYDSSVLNQLSVIHLAKEAGFTIPEIRTLIDGFERQRPPGRKWLALGERKIAEVDEQIQKLQTMKMVLHAVTKCECVSFDECAKRMEQRL